MTRFVSIRVSEELHLRIRAAAARLENSVNEFVQRAIMVTVQKVESRPARKSDQLKSMFVSAKKGGLGYRECGRAFAKYVHQCNHHELWELRQILKVVNEEMMRREKFRPLFQWGEKHFARTFDQVPQRRRKLFAEGFLDALALL